MALLLLWLVACNRGEPAREVVVYVSVDQVHAEPVLREFERRTGIKVRPVFDVEASKTTGLANRMVEERRRPQADVFWSGEFIQTFRLKAEGLLAASRPKGAESLPELMRDPDGYWFASGARFRAILVNTDKVKREQLPRRLEDFANGSLPGSELAIALPLFGTSSAQAAALYALAGREPARDLYRRLSERGVRVVDGNSVVRDLVASGTAVAGWTDSDDSCEAMARGAHVALVLPDQEGAGTLMIPGTVAMVAGARHPREAQALIEYLLLPETENKLIDSGFFQISVRPGGPTHPCLGGNRVRTMKLSLNDIASQLEPSRRDMVALFSH